MIGILTTGGTIEGLDYDNENDASLADSNSIKTLLKGTNLKEKYQIRQLFSKDSRFITTEDRLSIAEIVASLPNKKILITHGTITMVETARYLGKLGLDKTIILTGALISGTKPNSDAIGNLEFATAQFNHLDKGVFIAMQQTIFSWENVKKNTKTNQFEKLNWKR